MSNSEEVKRAQRRKKIHAVEMFGGKCCICGYNKCINALDFHHLEGKEEEPSYIIMRWSWERAKVELDKCILVCSNCHREIHYSDKDIDYKMYLTPWIEIECEVCKKLFESKEADRKVCSQACNHFGQRKVKRPSKERLIDLIDIQKMPFTTIGKMYGVSDNAVRKWIKAYS